MNSTATTLQSLPFNVIPTNIGQWQTQISREAIQLTAQQVEILQRVLNEQYVPAAQKLFGAMYKTPNFMLANHGVPALTVRFDMAPMVGDGLPGVYEVEANTAGFGVLDAVGLPIHEHIASALRAMGIEQLGVGVAPARAVQLEDLMVLADGLQGLGVRIEHVNVANGVPKGMPLWLRAGHEDLHVMGHLLPKCLNLHYHGGGHKGYLSAMDPTASRVSDLAEPGIEALLDRYDTGLTLKPISEWGTHSVECYARQSPWKKRGTHRERMKNDLLQIIHEGRGEHYITQQFQPPEYVEGGFRIWRVVAVWYPTIGYQVIGGLWNWRPRSLRIHGAQDAIFGPITLPE